MNRYAVTIASGEVSYVIYVLADDDDDAAFEAGRHAASFPSRFLRPTGPKEFKITEVRIEQ